MSMCLSLFINMEFNIIHQSVGLFIVIARLSKKIVLHRMNKGKLTFFSPLPPQRFLAILAQNQPASAYLICSSLIPGKIKITIE